MSRKVANKVVRGVTIVALIVLLTNGFAAVEGVSPAYAVGYQASGVAEAYAPIYAYAQAEADDTDFGNPCILRNLGNFTAGPVTCSAPSPPKIPVASATATASPGTATVTGFQLPETFSLSASRTMTSSSTLTVSLTGSILKGVYREHAVVTYTCAVVKHVPTTIAKAAGALRRSHTLQSGSLALSKGQPPTDIVATGVFASTPGLYSIQSNGVSINGSVGCPVPAGTNPANLVVAVRGRAGSNSPP